MHSRVTVLSVTVISLYAVCLYTDMTVAAFRMWTEIRTPLPRNVIRECTAML